MDTVMAGILIIIIGNTIVLRIHFRRRQGIELEDILTQRGIENGL